MSVSRLDTTGHARFEDVAAKPPTDASTPSPNMRITAKEGGRSGTSARPDEP